MTYRDRDHVIDTGKHITYCGGVRPIDSWSSFMATDDRGTVTELLRRIADGDRDAMEELFRTVLPQLADRAERYLRDYPRLTRELTPLELINEIYERIAMRLSGGLVDDGQHFIALACKHFRWELQKRIRRIGQRPPRETLPDDAPDLNPTPLDEAERKELEHLVVQAKDDLPEPMQTIVNMYFWEGLSVRDIERERHVPHTTVHAHLKTALRELRRQLGDAGGNQDD